MEKKTEKDASWFGSALCEMEDLFLFHLHLPKSERKQRGDVSPNISHNNNDLSRCFYPSPELLLSV